MKPFLKWINEQKDTEGSPQAAMSQRTVRTVRDRNRLTRIETMLHDLVDLKENIVDRRRTTRADN
jgi:hypothetical protein